MPYADYHGFDQTYFEGREVADPHPAGYYYYPHEPLDYDQYAAEIDSVIGSRKTLVAGCAYGFMVRYLVNTHGWTHAYGMDISQWAVDNALPDVADRVYQGDALDSTRYNQIARDARGPPRWDGIYTEYLLEHFTDAEAQQALSIMAAEADTVVHRIWSGTGHPIEDEYFNVKTVSEWQAVAADHGGTTHQWIDYDNPDDTTLDL